MNSHTGKLTEISPWGTGFIEDTTGSLFGFHYSMLSGYAGPTATDGSVELINQQVTFEIADGIPYNVTIQKSASKAKAGG